MFRIIFVSVGCLSLLLAGCKQKKELTHAQQTAIHYLYLPALISDTFSRQMWHTDLDFRGYDTEKQQLYFLAKKKLDRKDMLNILTLDSSLIEYAPCDTGLCEFGGMSGIIDGYYAFRIPCANLKVDTNKVFTFKYNDSTLNMLFADVMKEQNETCFYNTPKVIDLSHYYGANVYAANIGAYVSVKGSDNIVKKLANILTKDLETNEEKAQAFLRYVTNNITYSYEDLWYEAEIAKRAHEVLLSGDGDCSAKTTLFASLLEQYDIPYCLLYYKNHVNVGVKGNFANENGYTATIENVQYAIAETTVENYIIGKSRVKSPEILSDLLFYQDPRKSPYIFNVKTKEKFEFVEIADE